MTFAPTRRGALLGLVMFAGPAAARSCPPPRVLFVCPAGTVKSAIAREYLKRGAVERGLALEVQSRGVHPADHVSPQLAVNLRREGVDPGAEPLRALTPRDLVGVDIVVAFDEAAQAPGLAGARVWDIPSWNSQFPQAKAALASRIDALLAELSDRGCPG